MNSQNGEADPIVEILRRLGLARRKEAQALGLDKGSYQQMPHAQLEALMQPDQPEHIRYHAWLLRQSLGYALEPHSTNKKTGVTRYHGRCAMKMEHGRKVPATQADAAKDLTLINQKAGLNEIVTRQQIGRAQRKLEELQLARRRETKEGDVLLFCYVRPPIAGRRWKDVIRPDDTSSVSDRITITCRPTDCNWKVKFDLECVIRPEQRKKVEDRLKKFIDVHRPEIERLLRPADAYKEERKVERNTTTAAARKTANTPPLLSMAAAAGSGPTSTSSKPPKHQSFAFPLSFQKACHSFPRITEAFIQKLARLARQRRPAVTDQELADSLGKRPGQETEGLWTLTVPEDMDALNRGAAIHLSPEEIIERARAAEQELDATWLAARCGKIDAARRLLREPLHPAERKMLLSNFPQLEAEEQSRPATATARA